jgi:ribonuclease-3
MKFIKLIFLRENKFYFSIQSLTGLRPRNLALYKQALTHKSANIRKADGYLLNNERLEYLGDAILGAIIAHQLYLQYPRRSEGFLTKTRSKIVNRSLLNQIAKNMHLDQLVRSQSQIEVTQTHILGDALEALIGAIYIDLGYKAANTFITQKLIDQHINIKKLAKKDTNYKSLLIEWTQKHKKDINFITEEQHTAYSSTPIFISKAAIDEIPYGEGQGYSKKEAQQNAARAALKELKKEDKQNTAASPS